MLVKVLIKRQFKPGKAKEILTLLKEFRSKAISQQGYISGVTMTEHGNPLKLMVVGTWESMEDWMAWKQNKTRKEFESMLEIYQDVPTEYEEYIIGESLLD